MGSIRKTILLVDDMPTNLMIGKSILSKNYDVLTASSAAGLFSILEHTRPDLILLDIDMPVMNGYEALKRLKGDEQTRKIPVMFLSANRGPSCEAEGLDLGAVDYMVKPYSSQLLLKRVDTHLRLKSQEEIIFEYEEKLRQMEQEKMKAPEKTQDKALRTVVELVE
jgi:putative two-component system response regulator